MTLGQALRKYRVKSKMTLRDAAGTVGSSHNFIQRLECDEGNLKPLKVVGALFDAYKVPRKDQLMLYQMCSVD